MTVTVNIHMNHNFFEMPQSDIISKGFSGVACFLAQYILADCNHETFTAMLGETSSLSVRTTLGIVTTPNGVV